MRSERTATWDTDEVRVAYKEGISMAQSKKQLLKTVHRRCKKVGRALAFTNYRHGDLALLSTYGQLRLDILATMQALRQTPSAELLDVSTPVTFQHVDQLRQRLATLHMYVSSFVTIK